MTDATVDASVWIAAADPADVFHEESRRFLAATRVEGVRLVIPTFAMVEVACALSRRRRDPHAGQRLMEGLLLLAIVVQVPTDPTLLSTALQRGTEMFLRGADALYAAAAEITGSTLVSWDQELVQRAGALTPTDWLNANP
jgi:predicted nucleic acid-binding protein